MPPEKARLEITATLVTLTTLEKPWGRWRKRKGIATIRYKKNGYIVKAEIHWYEAHGIGPVEWKAKRELD